MDGAKYPVMTRGIASIRTNTSPQKDSTPYQKKSSRRDLKIIRTKDQIVRGTPRGEKIMIRIRASELDQLGSRRSVRNRLMSSSTLVIKSILIGIETSSSHTPQSRIRHVRVLILAQSESQELGVSIYL